VAGHRHALAQRGIGVGRVDHDPQAIDQVGAKIGGFHRLGGELGTWRDEADLALIDLAMRPRSGSLI